MVHTGRFKFVIVAELPLFSFVRVSLSIGNSFCFACLAHIKLPSYAERLHIRVTMHQHFASCWWSTCVHKLEISNACAISQGNFSKHMSTTRQHNNRLRLPIGFQQQCANIYPSHGIFSIVVGTGIGKFA